MNNNPPPPRPFRSLIATIPTPQAELAIAWYRRYMRNVDLRTTSDDTILSLVERGLVAVQEHPNE